MGSTRFLIIAAAVVLALGCYAPLSLTQGHTTSTNSRMRRTAEKTPHALWTLRSNVVFLRQIAIQKPLDARRQRLVC